MNTREIAAEYRLTHWTQIMQERKESGLSIKAFSEKAGFHENVYYYWQRKLRETICDQLTEQRVQASVPASAFTEVKLLEVTVQPSVPEETGQLRIDAAGVRITADGAYPTEKLAILLRELVRPC